MKDILKLKTEIEKFVPFNDQELKDKEEILRNISQNKKILTRDNNAHITVSAWIIDETHNYVLMAYHNIYNSWAWLGRHADGNANLKEIILKEINEESGLTNAKFLSNDIYSLEILPVSGHEKNAEYVSSHLHLNITYLLAANKSHKITIKPDENSKIGWIDINRISEYSNETWFVERIYSKLCAKLNKGCIIK